MYKWSIGWWKEKEEKQRMNAEITIKPIVTIVIIGYIIYLIAKQWLGVDIFGE